MGLLGTSTVIEDMGLLGVASVIEDMGILGTSANVTAMSNVSGAIANVNTVASNVSGVNSFAERYRVQSGVPSSDNDVGDLVFDTAANTLKVFGSSGFQNAGSSVNGTSARFHYDIGSAVTSVTGSDAAGNTLAYDAGFIDVYVNGVRMSTADVTITSGDTVTFASALASGDEVDIVAFGTFAVANIVSTGALNSGSITSGFGNIDTGSSTITTTGAITGGTLTGTLQTASQTNITSVGTLTSFRSTGIDDNANALALTIDSSENVTVGATSFNIANNGHGLGGGGNYAYHTATESTALFLNRKTSDGDILRLQKNNSTVGSIGVEGGDSLYILNGDTGLKFSGGADKIIPVTTNGSARNNGIDLGSSGGRFKNLYLGGGIYLGGTGSANYVDDYEEGTWTPVFSGAGSPSHTVQFGSYTKVGRLVHITIAMRATSISGSNTIKVTGLPFTSADSGDSQQRSTLNLSNCGHLVGLSVSTGRLRTSGSELHGVKASDSTSFMTAAQMTSSGGIEFAGEFTYYTS
jgi:hypothetical protein